MNQEDRIEIESNPSNFPIMIYLLLLLYNRFWDPSEVNRQDRMSKFSLQMWDTLTIPETQDSVSIMTADFSSNLKLPLDLLERQNSDLCNAISTTRASRVMIRALENIGQINVDDINISFEKY